MKRYVIPDVAARTQEQRQRDLEFCKLLGLDPHTVSAVDPVSVDSRRQMHYTAFTLREDGTKVTDDDGSLKKTKAKVKLPADVKLEDWGFTPEEQ